VKAHAKINLALVVGPTRTDGLHEVATVLQRIDLADDVELEQADRLEVVGFPDDTIVRGGLESLAQAAGVDPRWRVRIEKRIPVAAGLGGGSSDAAAALRLANETLVAPLPLFDLAASLGADVPFFLADGPQLATGTGASLRPVDLPQDYVAVLVFPDGVVKESTAAVYSRFTGADGFAERRAQLDAALAAGDLSALPRNDLASSPLAAELERLGAFRADVTGAGPVVYGLFRDETAASDAASELARVGPTWVARPAW